MIKNKAKVDMLKRLYPIGCKVKVIEMDDNQPIPAGSVGTVYHVDDIGQIHLQEFGLALIDGVDKFYKVGD